MNNNFDFRRGQELDHWLTSQHAAVHDDLDRVLDIEAGLHDALTPSLHRRVAADLDRVLDIQAGLNAIVTPRNADTQVPLTDVSTNAPSVHTLHRHYNGLKLALLLGGMSSAILLVSSLFGRIALFIGFGIALLMNVIYFYSDKFAQQAMRARLVSMTWPRPPAELIKYRLRERWIDRWNGRRDGRRGLPTAGQAFTSAETANRDTPWLARLRALTRARMHAEFVVWTRELGVLTERRAAAVRMMKALQFEVNHAELELAKADEASDLTTQRLADTRHEESLVKSRRLAENAARRVWAERRLLEAKRDFDAALEVVAKVDQEMRSVREVAWLRATRLHAYACRRIANYWQHLVRVHQVGAEINERFRPIEPDLPTLLAAIKYLDARSNWDVVADQLIYRWQRDVVIRPHGFGRADSLVRTIKIQVRNDELALSRMVAVSAQATGRELLSEVRSQLGLQDHVSGFGGHIGAQFSYQLEYKGRQVPENELIAELGVTNNGVLHLRVGVEWFGPGTSTRTTYHDEDPAQPEESRTRLLHLAFSHLPFPQT